MSSINYELIGIVIHSGQANAGHYYSFIKDTRGRYSNNTNQWYRFNDTSVEEIQLTEHMLEEECFGGTFRAQKDNNSNNSNDERTRFWNAYMLIYKCMEPSKLLPPPSNTNRLPTRNRRQSRTNQRDSLSQLADLVVQSEHNDFFQIKKSLIPSRVLACVKDENLEFLKNSDTYCDDYFRFIYNLCNVCFDESLSINSSSSYELCTTLALNFLFNTHLRTHRRLRNDTLQDWVQLLARLFSTNSLSCKMFYEFVFERQENGLKLYLLDCPIYDIRQVFEQICEHVLRSSYLHNDDYNNKKNAELFIDQLILLLDKSVVEQIKHSQAYFQLICSYATMNQFAIEYLIQRNTSVRLMRFLLGDNIDSRRWNSGQAKELGIIHEIISILALFCSSIDESQQKDYVEIINEMNIYFSAQWINRYSKEICYAFQEVSTGQLIRTLELMETLAKDNQAFSECLIRNILLSISQAHTNDLKSLFKLLSHILVSLFVHIYGKNLNRHSFEYQQFVYTGMYTISAFKFANHPSGSNSSGGGFDRFS